jgi:hypothetical protein
MLRSIDSDYRDQVANILKWLAFSLRPLRLDELAEIFILDHRNDIPFQSIGRLFKPEDVLMYLPGLVTKGLDTEIRLAHQSINEYLTFQPHRMHEDLVARFSITKSNAHLLISESCLAYHLHISKTELATEESLGRFALWEYATHWSSHLEEVARGSWTPTVTERAKQALKPRSQSLLNMIRIRHPESMGPEWYMMSELAAPLYYTAAFGNLQLTDLLITSGADINEDSPTSKSGNALQVAALTGNESMVKLLLGKGAGINAQGGLCGNALQAAVYTGKEYMVKLLLDKGANINAQGGKYEYALLAAADHAD